MSKETRPQAVQQVTQPQVTQPQITQPQISNKRRYAKRGFTLIELMVVLLIVSILGSKIIPPLADGWDQFVLRRIAAKVLVVISLARQHAIADERATLVRFEQKSWCIQYQDESEAECTLGRGTLPARYYFNVSAGSQFQLLYNAGRGFSPLSSGAIRLYSNSTLNHVQFVNSSVGRVRMCTLGGVAGIPAC